MSTAAQAKKQAALAALSVADEVAKGVITPAHLEQTAADECQVLFGQVIGPDDPLWPVQVHVAKQVLSLGGVPADELAEWLAVTRAAEPAADAVREPAWIEQALAATDAAEEEEP